MCERESESSDYRGIIFYRHINHSYVELELCLRTTAVNNLFAVGGCDTRCARACVCAHVEITPDETESSQFHFH